MIKNFLNNLGVYVLFSFLFFGMWEWVQTPFYFEPHKTLNQVVWDRLHCTGGDILILTISTLFSSFILKKNPLNSGLNKKDYSLISCIGVGYTAFSEYLNVYLHQSWAYSSLMPLFPIVNIGLIPLIQWMVLPTVILYVVKNFINNSNKGEKL